jgi:transposase/IS5 family transposase
MPHHIDANYDQYYFLPPCLEDWVPADHPARFIREFVNQLDLSDLTHAPSSSTEGRPRYSNKLLLKVWLYGRMHKMKSSREMEIGCYRDIGLIWLSGANYPDHNTIWRFYNKNAPHLKKILKQLIAIAVKGGLVGLVVQALDGTKIEALTGGNKGCSKAILKRILANLDQITEELSESKDEHSSERESSYRIPDTLSDPKELSQFVRELMRAEQQEQKVPLQKGITRQDVHEKLEELLSSDSGICHPSDPDARMMTCDNGKAFGYNAELVVDDKHGLIVGAAVTQETNDYHQLAPMIEQTVENTGQKATVTLADGGYCSGEQLHKVEQQGCSVLVNDTEEDLAKTKPFHISKFVYHEEHDYYTCPLGEKLLFRREKQGRGTALDREYICKNLTCPKKDECTTSKRGRTIRRSGYIEDINRNRKNIAVPENKKLLARRKVIVEPVFGHIKHNDGYRRWRVRGLAKVCAEWNLTCITYNLKKMYRLWQRGVFSFPTILIQPLHRTG